MMAIKTSAIFSFAKSNSKKKKLGKSAITLQKTLPAKGYATEAVKAFLAAMAKKLNIKEIYGICLAENTASVRVHKNADSPKSIRVLEIIRGEKFKLSKQSEKITTKITTFDTLFL